MAKGNTSIWPPEMSPQQPIERRLRPFMRWAGSKRLVLGHLAPYVPKEFGRYYEPFVGGGSLFLMVQPTSASIGDALEPLVDAWQAIRDDVDGVLLALGRWDFDRETYDVVRQATPEDLVGRAARFLYLNRGAYGGLWRLNRKGVFNVPWSQPKTKSPIDELNLRAVSDYLRTADVDVLHADFAAVTAHAQAGDFVFLDPPYSKGRPERPFIHYNEVLFDWEEQERLALEAARLRSLGATVLITNSTHPEVAALYSDFERVDVRRHSSLGSYADSSREITERIFFAR